MSLYTCGPTVYNYAHIGNLRTYIFEDIVKRTLLADRYRVKHVMNITDVGHLTSDADEGEDKMEKGAKRERRSVWDIAAFYTDAFKQNMRELNILDPDIWAKATDHIKEQVAWIQKLEKLGYTYQISDGIYFDTSKFPSYGALTGQKLHELKEGARVEKNAEKRHPTDFALWKLSPQGSKRQMEWPSPWGTGFPGWHIECSVMAQKFLGETIDIHCGGIDHIPTHHTNEIAQAEAVTGKPFVHYWVHGEFLVLNKIKMAKSGDHFITLQAVKDKGISPLAYRYFCLGAHYRSKLTFSWDALQGAQNALDHLYKEVESYGSPKIGCAEYEQKFSRTINDDLDTPRALAIMWDLIKSKNPGSAKKQTLLMFDKVLGLRLDKVKKEKMTVTDAVRELVEKREQARKKKDFKKSDELRKRIQEQGYDVQDTDRGPVIKKIRR